MTLLKPEPSELVAPLYLSCHHPTGYETASPQPAELGQRGPKAVVVLSARIGSTGELRRSLLEAARPHLLRIIGPTSIGLLAPRVSFNASFAHLAPHRGRGPQPRLGSGGTRSGSRHTVALGGAYPGLTVRRAHRSQADMDTLTAARRIACSSCKLRPNRQGATFCDRGVCARAGDFSSQAGRDRTRSRIRGARRCWLCRLAGAPGFEPGNGGTKNRCLTTWRRPNGAVPTR